MSIPEYERAVTIGGPEVLYCAQCRGGMVDLLISEARALPDAELFGRFREACDKRRAAEAGLRGHLR